MHEEKLIDLVDAIYEAAVQPDKYRDFLELLSDVVHGQWTMLMAHDATAWRSSIALSVGMDAEVLERDKYYQELNPFVIQGRPYMRADTVITGNMIVPDQELVRTEFYNDHMRPSDVHHLIGGTILRDQHGAALLTSLRSKPQGPFEEAEIELFHALDPHLRRALEIQKRLAMQDGHGEALDRIPSGCILLGKNGRVLSVNQTAERILARKDGIIYAHGRLDANAPESSSRIRELISSATSTLYQPEPGGVAAVLRASGGQPYTVLVAPLSRKPADWGGFSPAAVVFITDPDCAQLTEGSIAQLYRFTPAEARLARALANGEGLGQAAAQLEIGINTAKTHLQRIFAKTQTSRQAELVRLLAGIAAMTCLQSSPAPPIGHAAEPIPDA